MLLRRCALFVAVAGLAACSGRGGSGSSALPPAPQSQITQSEVARDAAATTAPAPTPTPIHLEPGQVNGTPNRFTPVEGDSASGGQGKVVDAIPCAASMSESNYHVHVFLGVMVNGQHVANPMAIGLHNPGAASKGWIQTASCYYYIHTHDSSGYIHIESPSSTPVKDSLYTLGTILDVWGQSLTSTGFANFSGPVHVFYATTTLGNDNGGSYVAYTGTAPRSIKLYSHEAIWIEVGTYVPPSQLPKVRFYTQY